MRWTVFAFAMLALPGLAQAQTPAPAVPLTAKCTEEGDTIRTNIDLAVTSLSELEGLAEGVPPEEWKFLQKERTAARGQVNAGRLELLSKRPYFQAFELREKATQFRHRLGEAKSARSLKGQLLSLYEVTTQVPDLNAALNSYIEVDSRRPTPVMSDEVQWRARA